MGVLYSFLQQNGRIDEHRLSEWLAEFNVQLPTRGLGREFTYSELRQAVEAIDYKFTVTGQSGDIWLEKPEEEQHLLHCLEWNGDDNSVARFFWKSGADWMLPIAQKLADITQSTMTIMNDSDLADLVFVSPRDEHKS